MIRIPSREDIDRHTDEAYDRWAEAQPEQNLFVADDLQKECDKVGVDLIAFGTGVMFVPSDGSSPRHVPLSEFRKTNRLDPFRSWPFPEEA